MWVDSSFGGRRALGSHPWCAAGLLILILAPGRAAWSQGSAPSRLPELTTAKQIRALTTDEANRGYPVRLRAVVTYSDLAGMDLFVQDSTGGIYINVGGGNPRYRSGELLEVEGVTEQPDFAPQIGKPRFRDLGPAPPPQARKVTVDDLLSSREDSQWVQLEGIVEDIEPDRGGLKLYLVSEGRHFPVYVMDATGLNRDRLVDAKVRITGVCASMFNSNNQLIGVRLDAPTSAQVSIEEPPLADPFSAPLRPINSLMAFTAQNTSAHRVRVRGTVTIERPKGVFIQDGRQGLCVFGLPETPLRPGDRVDAVGFADIGEFTPVLQHALFRRIGSGAVPPPLRVTAREAMGGDFDTLRVTLDATLRDVRGSETDRTLVLQDGGALFEAGLRRASLLETGRAWFPEAG